jgi:hypothetical protein
VARLASLSPPADMAAYNFRYRSSCFLSSAWAARQHTDAHTRAHCRAHHPSHRRVVAHACVRAYWPLRPILTRTRAPTVPVPVPELVTCVGNCACVGTCICVTVPVWYLCRRLFVFPEEAGGGSCNWGGLGVLNCVGGSCTAYVRRPSFPRCDEGSRERSVRLCVCVRARACVSCVRVGVRASLCMSLCDVCATAVAAVVL